jgi:16S rRNA (guanine(966)-N(2))-methyltransferase RsmD
MNGLRVIGGSAKGRRLKTAKTGSLRPVTDYIREALFDILASRVGDSVFLDLFAGSGSIGIEALSRGARQAVFVEKEPRTARLIKDNLATTGFSGQALVFTGDVFQSLSYLQRHAYEFDLVFIDPPFGRGLVAPTLEETVRRGLVAGGGLIVTRSARDREPEPHLAPVRARVYGDSVLRFYAVGEE